VVELVLFVEVARLIDSEAAVRREILLFPMRRISALGLQRCCRSFSHEPRSSNEASFVMSHETDLNRSCPAVSQIWSVTL
jgi:hypothetical protein